MKARSPATRSSPTATGAHGSRRSAPGRASGPRHARDGQGQGHGQTLRTRQHQERAGHRQAPRVAVVPEGQPAVEHAAGPGTGRERCPIRTGSPTPPGRRGPPARRRRGASRGLDEARRHAVGQKDRRQVERDPEEHREGHETFAPGPGAWASGEDRGVKDARRSGRRRLPGVVLERVPLGESLCVLAHHVEVGDLRDEVAVGGVQHQREEAAGHQHAEQEERGARRMIARRPRATTPTKAGPRMRALTRAGPGPKMPGERRP